MVTVIEIRTQVALNDHLNQGTQRPGARWDGSCQTKVGLNQQFCHAAAAGSATVANHQPGSTASVC